MAGENANTYSSAADKQNADQGWDTYNERVLRNEGRLIGLEELVKETRLADAKLVEMRSSALAKELSDTAASLNHLMAEQRAADKEEFRAELAAAKELSDAYRQENEVRRRENMSALREIYDTATMKNYEQSNAQIRAADDRSEARVHALEMQVQAWRDSDREAREIQAEEYARRLAVLNNEHGRTATVLNNSVTRELWDNAEKAMEAKIQAVERSLTEKIGQVERAILLMPTIATAQKDFDTLNAKIEAFSTNVASAAIARYDVVNEKITELKNTQILGQGRGSGMNMLYGWLVAAIGLVISVIVAANAIFGK